MLHSSLKWWKSQEMSQKEHLRIKSDLSFLNQVLDWFDRFSSQNMRKFSWLAEQSDALKLALDEAFTNAVRHAHKNLPPETPIDIELSLCNDRVEIRLWDYGEPFDPDTVAEPELGTLQAGGYGWFLMRRIADNLVYERCENGRNRLTLIKYKNSKK